MSKNKQNQTLTEMVREKVAAFIEKVGLHPKVVIISREYINYMKAQLEGFNMIEPKTIYGMDIIETKKSDTIEVY